MRAAVSNVNFISDLTTNEHKWTRILPARLCAGRLACWSLRLAMTDFGQNEQNFQNPHFVSIL
jgi:hypothetical protein